jgi:hypothetical protein
MMTDEPIIAFGAPYHVDDTRVMFCQHGQRWCGWVRTSNSAADHERYTEERNKHERNCKGGLILL